MLHLHLPLLPFLCETASCSCLDQRPWDGSPAAPTGIVGHVIVLAQVARVRVCVACASRNPCVLCCVVLRCAVSCVMPNACCVLRRAVLYPVSCVLCPVTPMLLLSPSLLSLPLYRTSCIQCRTVLYCTLLCCHGQPSTTKRQRLHTTTPSWPNHHHQHRGALTSYTLVW